jgi:tetratricopeptide (TPR) repeat protein
VSAKFCQPVENCFHFDVAACWLAASNHDMAAGTPKPGTSLRVWLGRLALAVGVPLFLFGSLELGLRLARYGQSFDFFIPTAEPGIFRTNSHFTDVFFPASFGLKPVNFKLPVEKPPGELRVFVVGESAAMGVPEPGFGIAPQLQAQLHAAWPGRPIRVYNLGITAINSHAIVPIVHQAVKFHPDLLVVYMGNNEVIGPYGPSSVATGKMLPRSLIHLSLWLRRLRLGQLLAAVLQKFRPSGSAFRDWRGMEMFANKVLPADDPRLGEVYENFSANLDDILDAARAADVKVVLSTVAVNVRDCAPFVSRHGTALTPSQLAGFSEAMARGDYAGALAIDPLFAEAHFRLARSLESKGELEAARGEYLAALQWDALRFRADARLNQLIRTAARARTGSVALVDAVVEMGADAASQAPPAGGEFFFEHVHLTWQGNYVLARLLAEGAAGMIGGPHANWLSPEDCAAALGYTAYGHSEQAREMEQLTGRPPFTQQTSFASMRIRLAAEIAASDASLAAPGALSAVAAAVGEARRRDPTNLFLWSHESVVRAQLGETGKALELNTLLAGMEPASPELAAQRGFFLERLGRESEAERVLLESAASSPYYFQTYSLLAQLWIAGRQWPRAIDYFSGLVQRMPDSVAARHAYAQVLAESGDWTAAESQWRLALRLIPDDEAALGPLSVRLLQRGSSDEAIALMTAAYAYNPHNLANNQRLAEIFDQRGDTAEAVKYMQALSESGPVNALLYRDLALNLGKLGRRQEMRAALEQGRQLAVNSGDPAILAEIDRLLQENGETR